MVARGVGRELAASVAAHRDILYRIQHPCGMIIPCFSPVVNTFFCGFGGSRNFRDIVTKTTGYSGVVWLKGRPGGTVERGEPRARRGACPAGCRLTLPFRNRRGGLPSLLPAYPAFGLLSCPHSPAPPFPAGRGRFLVFLCKGLRPLHPRGWMGRGTGSTCVSATRRGACPLCRLPPTPLVLILPPIPPARARRAIFPGGEGGYF